MVLRCRTWSAELSCTNQKEETMELICPAFEEIILNCEINSYASADV